MRIRIRNPDGSFPIGRLTLIETGYNNILQLLYLLSAVYTIGSTVFMYFTGSPPNAIVKINAYVHIKVLNAGVSQKAMFSL